MELVAPGMTAREPRVSKRTMSEGSERSIMKGARQLLLSAGNGNRIGTRGSGGYERSELFTVSQFLAIQRHPSIS